MREKFERGARRRMRHGRRKRKGTGGIQFSAGGDGQVEAKAEVAVRRGGSLSVRLRAGGMLKLVKKICVFMSARLSRRYSWFF